MGRFLVLIALLPTTLFAQNARVTTHTTELAGITVFRDVKDDFNAQVYNLEAPSPDGNADKIRLMKAKQQVAELYPRREARAQSKATATIDTPLISKSYLADTFSGVPPDNDVAISKNNMAISVINSMITILDGNTGNVQKRNSLGFFTAGLGLNGNRYDPKVQYDADADRFICIMLSDRDSNNHIVVGFSQSGDPLGGWAFYKFYGDYKKDTTWFDYPGVVMTKDELFITGNQIKFEQPWETGFSETVIYQVNKKDGYNAANTLNYKIWDGIQYNGQSIRNLFPVRPGRELTGAEQYFLSNRNFDTENDTIFLVKVPGDLSANNQNVTIEVLKSPVKYGVPPNGMQPDKSVVLNTNDGRILGAYAMNDEIQFVSTSVVQNTGASGIFHGIISNYDSAPEMTYADIYGVNSLDLGYPNISYAGDSCKVNYSIISFDYTGADTWPGFGVVANFNGAYSDMVRVKEGEGSIIVLEDKLQRWGDYTGTQVDYNDTSTIWMSGLYGRADSLYGTWVAGIKSPFKIIDCKNDSQGPSAYPTAAFPNPAEDILRCSFEMPADGQVQFRIFSTAGADVKNVIVQDVKQGKNLIQLNIGHLSRGIYYLRGTTNSGDMVLEQKFLKR